MGRRRLNSNPILQKEEEMSSQEIGTVKSGKGVIYYVKWDSSSHEVYVSYAGWSNCGQASSAGDAMRRAEAYLHDK